MMMMSIFSSFDALLAESFGQKVGLSWAPSKPDKDSSAAIIIDPPKGVAVAPSSIQASLNKRSIGKSSPPSSSSSEANKSQEQKQRRPRFAPELDGVHCFETIIPY